MILSSTIQKKYKELPKVEKRYLRQRFEKKWEMTFRTMELYLSGKQHCAPTVGGWLAQHITERWSACFENQEVESELEEETQTV